MWWTFFALPITFQYFCISITALAFGGYATTLAHRVPLAVYASADATAEFSGGKVPMSLWEDCRCPHCDAKIAPWHTLPIVGYLLLKGRCSHCGHAISPRYLLLEVGALAIGVVLYAKFGPTARFAGGFFFAWTLLLLAAIDAEHLLLPDMLTLPLLWLGLLIAAVGGGPGAASAILGAMAGYFLLFAVSAANQLVTGFGMGGGDMKLFAAMAAWLGWQAIPQLLLISALLSVTISTVRGLSGTAPIQAPKAFGPSLAVAGIATYCIGDVLPMFYR